MLNIYWIRRNKKVKHQGYLLILKHLSGRNILKAKRILF